MKNQAEIEATICQEILRFQQEYLGRRPSDCHVHLIGDLLVIRLKGVLSEAEHRLIKPNSPDKGRDLLKTIWTRTIETARPVLESLVEQLIGLKPVSLHYDLSTVSGEEILLFVLNRTPE